MLKDFSHTKGAHIVDIFENCGTGAYLGEGSKGSGPLALLPDWPNYALSSSKQKSEELKKLLNHENKFLETELM